jgi:signal transduction histidine kinase
MTVQRRLEAEVQQSQRMRMLGRLVAGIAHDFGNVLGIVAGAAMLGREQSTSDLSRQTFSQISRAAEYGTAIVRRLLAFARPGATASGNVDVNALVQETAPLLEHLLGGRVHLRIATSAELGPVRCDPGELTQALMNLVSNARDAMPDGGTVTLQTSPLSVDARHARRLGIEHPGAFVAIGVSDGGGGMDEATRAHLFEPFFTTKPRGEGNGLGLAAVHEMVHRARGGVDVQSHLGVGTIVTLLFPVVAATPPERTSAPPAKCAVFVEEIARSKRDG